MFRRDRRKGLIFYTPVARRTMVVAPTYPEKKRLNLLKIMLRRMVVAPLTFWLIYVVCEEETASSSGSLNKPGLVSPRPPLVMRCSI